MQKTLVFPSPGHFLVRLLHDTLDTIGHYFSATRQFMGDEIITSRMNMDMQGSSSEQAALYSITFFLLD